MVIRVVELFAGVGGFRLGLEGPVGSKNEIDFNVVWSNQWEPSTVKQHAAIIYAKQWNLVQSLDDVDEYYGEDELFVNKDISKINAKDIPQHDLLCGGFPCQDYSVAKTSAKGIEGKKECYGGKFIVFSKKSGPEY